MRRQPIAIGERLHEVPAGVDDQHRGRRIYCRREMAQHRRLSTKRGHNNDLAWKTLP